MSLFPLPTSLPASLIWQAENNCGMLRIGNDSYTLSFQYQENQNLLAKRLQELAYPTHQQEWQKVAQKVTEIFQRKHLFDQGHLKIEQAIINAGGMKTVHPDRQYSHQAIEDTEGLYREIESIILGGTKKLLPVPASSASSSVLKSQTTSPESSPPTSPRSFGSSSSVVSLVGYDSPSDSASEINAQSDDESDFFLRDEEDSDLEYSDSDFEDEVIFPEDPSATPGAVNLQPPATPSNPVPPTHGHSSTSDPSQMQLIPYQQPLFQPELPLPSLPQNLTDPSNAHQLQLILKKQQPSLGNPEWPLQVRHSRPLFPLHPHRFSRNTPFFGGYPFNLLQFRNLRLPAAIPNAQTGQLPGANLPQLPSLTHLSAIEGEGVEDGDDAGYFAAVYAWLNSWFSGSTSDSPHTDETTPRDSFDPQALQALWAELQRRRTLPPIGPNRSPAAFATGFPHGFSNGRSMPPFSSLRLVPVEESAEGSSTPSLAPIRSLSLRRVSPYQTPLFGNLRPGFPTFPRPFVPGLSPFPSGTPPNATSNGQPWTKVAIGTAVVAAVTLASRGRIGARVMQSAKMQLPKS